MLKDNIQKGNKCKAAGIEIFKQLESQGIIMVSCIIQWNDDKTDFIINITIHISEKNNNHKLPASHKGFKIKYQYTEIPQLY